MVRIDDLDAARVVAGATDDILRTLERFGFCWDGSVVFQSQYTEVYLDAVQQMLGRNDAYPCACSRSDIARLSSAGASGRVYPGTCRAGLPPGQDARSIRVRTRADPIDVKDRIQGPFSQNVEREVGDFPITRVDGPVAYHLAIVMDDDAQGITEVVRGADLLDSTPRQIHLQRLLGIPTPAYAHLPVAVDGSGAKLSKQTGASPLNPAKPAESLVQALRFLGLHPPESLTGGDLPTLWQWAEENWKLESVPKVSSQPASMKNTG